MKLAIQLLIALGLFFNLVGVVGVLRLPDVYTRLQATTCLATMGTIPLGLAGVLHYLSTGADFSAIVKLLLLMGLVLVTNPIAAHALCKAAVKTQIPPARPLAVDDWKEDQGS